MAQTGYTPIQLYHSTTAAAAPTAGNLANGELALNITDGKLYYKDNGGNVQLLASQAGAAGDVVGPASATDNALVRFDATTGKLVQNSVGILSDTGDLSGIAALSMSGALTLSGGTANGVAYLNSSKVLTTGGALVFDSTNRLGIQVTPMSTGANGDDLQIGDPTTNVGAGLTIGSTTTADIQFSDATSGAGQYAGLLRYVHSNDSMQFWAASAEQMRLTSTGLGIGTSSPGVKLDTVGAMRGTFNSTSNGGPGLHGLELRQSTTSTKALIAGYSTSGNQTGAYIQAVNFGTAYEDLVLQPQGGNLGLGVTPSAWGSTYKAIQLGLGGVLFGRTGVARQVGLSANAYDGGSGSIYMVSGQAATSYQQDSGIHYWFTAPSGTAGNAISFTQAMTLDASGALLVGATSLAGTNNTKLVVQDGAFAFFGNASVPNASAAIYRPATHTIGFVNNGAESARIDSSGNLLVGQTTSVGARVQIGGFNDGSYASSSGLGVFGNSHFQNGLRIGALAGSGSRTVTADANGTLSASSDSSLKQEVDAPVAGLAEIMQVQPKAYKWLDDIDARGDEAAVEIGFFADQVAPFIPSAAPMGNDGKFGFYDRAMIAALTKAIQEQQAQIEQLRAEIQTLKGN